MVELDKKIENKDYSNITKKQLAKDVFQFQKYMIDSIAYFGSTRPEYTYQAEKKLEKIVKKNFDKDWNVIFGTLVNPIELDDVQKEYLERLKLIASGITDNKIKKHLSRFPWLVGDYLNEERALSFMKNIFNGENSYYKKEKNRIDKEKSLLKKQQNGIYNTVNAYDKKILKYLSKFLQNQSIERMNIKAYWIGCYYLSKNMWLEVTRILKLNINDILKFVALNEIIDILNNNYKENIHEIIKLRKKSYAINLENKKLEILNYEEADKLFDQKIKKLSSKDKIIKGQTASLGTYKGKVRKVIAGDLKLLKKSIKNFKMGEVLVTSMTQPNMMVIARKAGAIITDEGGITSHAAIISRELKIPCIVGCLKSMQVLKDGDLVEVDANRGIVKILKN